MDRLRHPRAHGGDFHYGVYSEIPNLVRIVEGAPAAPVQRGPLWAVVRYRSLCARLAALNFRKKNLSADDCRSSGRRQAGRINGLQQRVVVNVVGVRFAHDAMLSNKVVQDNNAALDDAPLLSWVKYLPKPAAHSM